MRITGRPLTRLQWKHMSWTKKCITWERSELRLAVSDSRNKLVGGRVINEVYNKGKRKCQLSLTQVIRDSHHKWNIIFLLHFLIYRACNGFSFKWIKISLSRPSLEIYLKLTSLIMTFGSTTVHLIANWLTLAFRSETIWTASVIETFVMCYTNPEMPNESRLL